MDKRKASIDSDDEIIPATPEPTNCLKINSGANKSKCRKLNEEVVTTKPVIFDEKQLVSEMFEDDAFEESMFNFVGDAPVADSGAESTENGSAIDACFEDEMPMDMLNEESNNLNLTTWKRCIVDSLTREGNSLILRVHEDRFNDRTAVCRLRDQWASSKISQNDLVSISAVWDQQLQCYSVTNDKGFVIIVPDHLISGTTVVGGLFCQRKAVLADRFTGTDCNNRIMAIGSIIHEIFQIVLRRKMSKRAEIESICDEIIQSQQMIYTLYEIQMSSEEIKKEIYSFIPKIIGFVESYIDTAGASDHNKVGPSDKIESINDIEENIWIPTLGLKGKVDVSVTYRRRNGQRLPAIPLEIKTGKASFSNEHRGQVILYQMMMSEIGEPVEAGLLLYIREGIMQEVTKKRNDQRDIILLRNDLAHYMSKNDVAVDIKANLDEYKNKIRSFGIPDLPDPIHHHSACGNCPYNIICGSFLSRSATQLSDTHPMQQIIKSLPVTSAHIDYFIKWTGLLALEADQSRNENQLKSMWTESGEKRQKRGRALIDLEICADVLEIDDQFVHVFTPKFGAATQVRRDLTLCGFNVGDYLRVSTSNRVAIAAGRVEEITRNTISMRLERNLTDRYLNSLFILDKNETNSIFTFNMANIGALLNDRVTANQLRSIIIDRMPPTFSRTLPKVIATEGKPILARLNIIQQKAVLKALTANEYLLLKGLPGTGKTQTLVAIVQLLVMMGKSVLITSHTHSAVDNVLLRLKSAGLQFLRLADPSRVNVEIRSSCAAALTIDCKTPQDLHYVYNSYNIVGVTCLGAGHPLLIHRTFDVCIVDEATQVQQSTVIRPLLSATKFILVGDPEQLPPIIKSKEAKYLGADESLFSRLDCEAATFTLTMQYRMNKTITKLANQITYNGDLICANDSVALATLQMPRNENFCDNFKSEKWLLRTLSTHLDQSIILLNTSNVFDRSVAFEAAQQTGDKEMLQAVVAAETAGESEQKTRIYVNYAEVAIVLSVVQGLIQGGVPGSSIGIIAPYAAQVALLKHAIAKFEQTLMADDSLSTSQGIEVNTVDQYQGRDKEIIIYSCTKCDNPQNRPTATNKEVEILEDCRRLTVGITRSKHKLIMIADVASLDVYTPFQKLFQSLGGMSKMNLVDGKQGFVWTDLMEKLKILLDN